MPILLTLPFPPSINHYWRRVGNKTIISAEGRTFRREAIMAIEIANVGKIDGRLRVGLTAFPPDRRRRDLDNLIKACLDAIQHGGVYEDDSQIDSLSIVRGDVAPPGRLHVEISRIGE